ncbi:MAG TPA: enoyl-CoA hydratase/isomerase family protein [Sphingopyxis sp.]|uniref:enoyl-CoA hydratase/isomerase family protein n=1 Tax=Sphingopyxis sp. TaxID=1908224 RepID=UPI002E35E0AC|nr:enoyl-CoA hydratase/isomerase family protein [Sphingopyxis sp.]HEX2813961.1 enoyl-CoA hydratase/isomerase family protein [Sphingopyxis sp.]
MTELVLSEREGALRILTLNRPGRHNAMDDAMSALFQRRLGEALEESESSAILIRAAGKSFCSGRDTNVLGHRARDESDFHFVRRHQEGRLRMQESTKPIIAALKGGAIGGGCELALAADIRVSDTTLKLALPEILYGVLPDTGGTQMMTALIGPSRTKYMVMTGRPIDAPTALEWGAVDFVVAREELDDRALEIARDIAARPPINLAMAKEMVNLMHGPTIRTGTRAELYAQSYLFKTEDYQEARAAHREKRAPSYKGK